MQVAGMDLPSKTMYDTFKGDIWKELGPLDPDWFEALTAQAFSNDGNVSDQEELCANQEGCFKTPFDKTAVDSQLFSTPKVFRHSRIVSPETEDEKSFAAEQEKETLPWMTTQSPCLFQMSKQGVEGMKYGGIHPQSQDSFDLLNTPDKSSVSYAKNISESLGVQINPDISWTSSFNTPPAIPSTLILSKHDESPCPVSLPENKNVVLVRKLFPSLSNSSRLVSPKNSDLPSGHQGVVSPEPDQNPESHNCPQTSLNQSDGVWKQMLPDAIEDKEMRSTIASVLDGAEDVLSIFFTNSSSALRRVKTERIRRKQITQTKQHGCISTDISTTNNTASSEQRPADQDPGRLPSPPPVKPGDIGITQWSPLSLSEIPPCTVDTSCPDDGAATQVENNVSTKQLRSDFESGQLVRPPTKITDCGFTKKKRTFVYTVQSSKLQVQREDRPSQRIDSSPGIQDSGQKVNAKQLVKAPDETDCIRKNEMSEQGNLVEESLPHSVQAKAQDLDISQLSKDFAQDFSQMTDPSNLSKVAVQNVFSPSACLSAMKQTNQRERQAKLHPDCDGIKNRGSVFTPHQNNSICEGAVSDSGFQSGVGDISHVTASSFVPPSSENNGQHSGFKTDIYRTTPFPSTNKESRKAHLDDILQEAGTDAKLCSSIKESRTLSPSEMYMESTSTQLRSSAKGTVDTVNCTPFNGQAYGSLPEKTTISLPSAHASGFKTASNKGIQISSANLEKAKRLFEETEGEQTLSNQPIKCVRSTKDELRMGHGSLKNTTSNSLQPRSSSVTFVDNSCQLTASQKADVTELCTLLEEADSQFEFTQFRTAKPRQHCPDNATSPPKIDKELDPDFLTGIDFDDSFNSDAEKQLTCDQMTSVSDDKTKNKTSVTSKSTGFSLPCAIKKEDFSTEDVSYSVKHISEGSSGIVSSGSKSLDRSGHTEASKLDNKNTLMLGVGFKTAGGNVLRVSKTCLNKARALFADLEENPVTCEKPQESSKTYTKPWHKRSADNSNGNSSTLVRHKEDRRPAVQHTEVVQHNVEIHNFVLKNTPASTKAASPHGTPSSTAKAPSSLPCTATSKNIGPISINELSNAGGFCTAGGEKVIVSADAMKKAECLLNDIHTLEGANKELKQKGGALKTGHIINQIQVSTPKSGGFQTASGKGVTISSEALKKAKSLLSECDGVEDKICAKPTHSKTPVPGPPPRNSGFLAASGKPVAFSSEALRKAKALFSDISLNAEIPAISDTRNSDKKQDVNNIEKIHCGFSTAMGEKVHVSQKNLLKAKNLLKEFDDGSISAKATQEADAFFKDCDNQDGKDGMSINHWKSVAPVSDNGSEKKSLPKFKQDHKVTNISEESGSGHTKLEKMSMERNVNYEKMLDSDNMKIHKVVLNNTPDPDCSSGNKLSSTGGFCTASGKKVSVSDEAMTKAKSLLNENATFEDKQLKQKDTLPPQNAGFQTASGKGVAISSAALKKAKFLLSECEGVEDQIAAKPTHSKMPVPGPPPRNHGFLAASGKSVAFSTEALQKAKALFSDMDFSADVPAVSHKTKSEHKDAQNATEKIHCGFSTARGAKVHVSHKNLLKAKNLLKEFDDGSISAKATQEADAFFKDCDNQDGKDGMSINHWKSVAPVSDNGSENKSLPKFKQDHKVTNISEESGSGHTKLEKMSMERIVNYEKMLDSDNMKIHKVVLNNTPDPDCSSGNKLSSSGGFCTASGKKVSVSDEAMTKAKSLLNENATLEDKQLRQKDTLLPQNAGFQTASGKGVAISSGALKKAKTLLSECEGVEDQIAAKPTHSKMPVPGPPPRNHGFLAASGKSVAFSTEALKKAKALFSDMDFSADVPAVSHKTKIEHKDAQNDTEKIHCGFSTAGGAKVHVSQKNLLKAKNLFNDLTGVECHDSNSTSPADIHKLDILKVKDVNRASNSNLTTASERDIPANESAPQIVTSLQETDHENDTLQSSSVHDCIFMKDRAPTDAFKIEEGRITSSGVGSLHDNPREEMSTVLNHKINQTSSSGGSKVNRTEESSVLCFESFNLSGCTETQQRLLAQEALDCTKALLEDENLAGQRLSMTLESVPQQDNSKSMSVKDQRGGGKRHVEDPDITGQPPLKRRLLEEFDRTVEGPRGSTLHPEKSIPDGVMKDRRVFKYGVSLHANITRPHRNGNSYVETRIQKTPSQHSVTGDSRSAHSKMPMFVPPFLKNTESRKNTVIKDSIRTPSAFVPPFKKQRTIVKESSSTPQEEEKLQHTVTPFNSNTYVPPAKTTQSTSDVTGDKSKEDIQMVALVDTTNDNLVNNEKIPVGCGSEGSSAEALCVEDTLFRSQDMFQDVHNIELARDMQHMRIRKKKRQTIRPLPGSLFLTKSSGVQRIPLKAAVNGKPPARFSPKQLYSLGVHQHACEVTSETAESFRFTLRHFVKQEAFIDGGGVQLADGGWLIPSNDGTAGKEEFYRALCDTPGVDPKLISEEWVYNHYRWIVWKRASMERSFPETMGSLGLTPEQVLLQLKYRYDVEVDHSRRPALRKIMEKDDTAAKTLVLCVCGVVSRGHSPKRHSCSDVKTPGADSKVENPSAVVWLTDGWYAIKAQLDEPLTAMLHKGRLAVGGKLIIHGAQLVGSQDACSPLEAPDSLMLKICANSSRPAQWHAKLGFHKDPRPFLLPISSLYSNGGPVGCVDIIILRSYPIQWMERKPDGGVVFRSVRAEEKEARRYNNHKQKAMEVLFAKIQAEFEKEEKGNSKPQRRRRTISRQDIASLQDGEELYEAVGDDAAYLEAHLSEQQLEALYTYRRSQMDKKQAELQDRYRRALENAEDQEGSCPKRDVTPVWRVCIADSMDQPGSVYQLNLWRPPSDLQSLLKEGCRYKVYNLTTSDGKKHGGSTTVQLTGTKKTQFQDLQAPQDWLSTHFQPRVSTHFVKLQNTEFQSLCGEVDLTGYVISIIDGQGFSPAFYLADGKLNFVKVRCFSSFAQSGLEDLVKPRVLLALSNLQLRGQSASPTPVVYAGDLTVFSTNPKEVHLQESLSQLRNLVQGQENFFLTAEEKLSHLVKSDGLSSISSPALQARTPATDKKDTKSVTSQQPVRGFGCFTPVTRNPPATNCSTEKNPIHLKRRRALDYLSRIPSPPPLSNLGSVASPCVNKTFNPPRRSGTPSTLKTVQTPACKPVNSPLEDEWVNDEELAMIDTQALLAHD